MNRLHRLRVALICACALVAGCKGGDGGEGASAAAPTPALAPPPTGSSPPPATPTAATAAVTVSWVAPLENVDGTALTDLAGFVIAYGTASDALSESVYIDNPSIDRYLLENLASGTWYFGVKAYSSSGEESELSTIVSKKIG